LSFNATRPLRVALVTSSYNYIKDGIALTLNRLVAYLEGQGVEVLVLAPVGPVAALAHSGTLVEVPSIALPSRPEYRLALGLAGKARARLEGFAPDLVHIAVPDLLGYGALRWARARGIPAVASYHTRYETYLKHYWYVHPLTAALTRYLRWFYGACRDLYVPSPSMIEALEADGFHGHFRLWPRGVDTKRFNPAKRSPHWRDKNGIGGDELVFLHVARLVREKQLDTLVGITRRMAERAIPHRLVIVGDGPERAMLERELPQGFFTGFLDGEDLAEAYAASDVFLFPSDTESFGNVTLEAMASGLPCLCADATGSRSLVVAGETGFLAAPGRVEDFADRAATLAGDGALRRRMGEAGRARSLLYDWDAAMARVLGYYREAAGGDAAA
jgi:glycosyltransferase involved in cell wall biosynthesis